MKDKERTTIWQTILVSIVIGIFFGYAWRMWQEPEFVVTDYAPKYIVRYPCFECHPDGLLVIVHDLKEAGERKRGNE